MYGVLSETLARGSFAVISASLAVSVRSAASLLRYAPSNHQLYISGISGVTSGLPRGT